ncbi:MAG: aromatic ring-hydroxylating dioxygenase subunit alpha [Pseudomonadales bacterium]|nr:aromatic ring-hydroxylating dioxygenase subunit alpha [Pseudomonadales bacterium]MCP5182973.1 aromatic ring-hydroxylating dioxygenase subunit alpha [Pseudomonadales bacterium]
MIETSTGTDRSAGIDYQKLLAEDSHPVPDIFRAESPMPPGPTVVPAEQYYSKAFHDLEVEKVWKRVWQMACHEDDIPEVGDYLIYDIANLSFLVVRHAQDDIRAYYNVCLHRGRLLKSHGGKRAREFRCSFHGWAWNTDGKLKEVPCQWDFPTVSEATHSLPPVKVGRWAGFVFINPDENAESLESFLGNLSDQFPMDLYSHRTKAAHVAKILRCNWKVAQEAFSEAYHVIATHPTILESIGDANTKYDVFGNYCRAMSPNFTPSPHVSGENLPDWKNLRQYTRLRHALTGHLYEMHTEDDTVHVTNARGEVSRFTTEGVYVDGPMTHADPNMINWVGGRQLPGTEVEPLAPMPAVPPGKNLRQVMAEPAREAFRRILGDQVDQISDAAFLDSIYLTLFPNFHPWGTFSRIMYRFRPNGDNPEECIMECIYMVPTPVGQPRGPAAPIHWLGPDDDWVDAPELGMLAKVFNQDVVNMPEVQKGLKAMKKGEVIFANYGETKPRHFHKLLDEWIAKP